jgi:hypothetical protein
MPNHTKGEWKIVEGKEQAQFVIEDDNGYCIASVGQEWSSIRNRKIVTANAKLIAAAPNLLRVLEMIAGTHSPWACAGAGLIFIKSHGSYTNYEMPSHTPLSHL